MISCACVFFFDVKGTRLKLRGNGGEGEGWEVVQSLIHWYDSLPYFVCKVHTE